MVNTLNNLDFRASPKVKYIVLTPMQEVKFPTLKLEWKEQSSAVVIITSNNIIYPKSIYPSPSSQFHEIATLMRGTNLYCRSDTTAHVFCSDPVIYYPGIVLTVLTR